MRKTILIALAALLVMLAASCDNSGFVAGERLVTLSVKSDKPIGLATDGGNSRSLTTANAQSEKAYVEVIFQDTDTSATPRYWRAAGPYKETTGGIDLKVKVKTGKRYNALILIGSDDGTLLATGKPADAITVSTDSTVTFYVNALKSNISPVTVGSVDPDFSIDTDGIWDSSFASTADKFKNGPGDTRPCFLAPADSTTDLKATLTIHGFDDFTPSGGSSITGTGDNIFVKGIPKVTFTKIGSAPAITATDITPLINTAITTDGELKFNFKTTDSGQYEITFEFPVVGFAVDVPQGLTWHIRGGTASGLDFIGTGSEEAIALLVTDDADMSTLSVGTPPWQP